MPNSLVIEGMAQTGGLLVCEHGQLRREGRPGQDRQGDVLSATPCPATSLIYTADVEYIKKDGAMVTATSHEGDVLHAEMEIVFAHLNDRAPGQHLFEPDTFLQMMRMLGAFEVGHAADGGPLVEPADLTES